MHEYTRHERPAIQAEVLPWDEAVAQQADHLIYKHYLGNYPLPGDKGPAMPLPEQGWFKPTETDEERNKRWQEDVSSYVRDLREMYASEHKRRPLPSLAEFEQEARNLIQRERVRAYGSGRSPVQDFGSLRLHHELVEALKKNPVRFRALKDKIEVTKNALLLQEQRAAFDADDEVVTREHRFPLPATRDHHVGRIAPAPIQPTYIGTKVRQPQPPQAPPAQTIYRGSKVRQPFNNEANDTATEAAKRERAWAESYFPAMRKLENPDMIVPGSFGEINRKIKELETNPQLLRELIRLRNKYQLEDWGRN